MFPGVQEMASKSGSFTKSPGWSRRLERSVYFIALYNLHPCPELLLLSTFLNGVLVRD